jgi:hypothetical protein
VRLHHSERWKRMARHQLRVQPLCEWCLREGRVTAARVCDHVEPHHGDVNKFWLGKLQSLCRNCHESRKKFRELNGYDRDVGADGLPLDPRHPVIERKTRGGGRVLVRGPDPLDRPRRPSKLDEIIPFFASRAFALKKR